MHVYETVGCKSMERLGASMQMLGACLWNGWVKQSVTCDTSSPSHVTVSPQGTSLQQRTKYNWDRAGFIYGAGDTVDGMVLAINFASFV